MRKKQPTMTDAQAAAATLKASIAMRQARGERVSQSAISEAIRRCAEADMDAQFAKSWERTGDRS
jgi:hypothetical protein